MAKELPYYKFISTEWLTGNISFEPLDVQGLFINICALYWQRDGVLKISEVEHRYKRKSLIAKLNGRFFSVSDGFISIEFLDEQFTERQHVSQTNSENGKKGGRPHAKKNKAKKSNIEEEEELKENKKEKEIEIVFPFTSDNFLSSWNAWKGYKQLQHKFIFKTKISEQAALKKLSEDSGCDELMAVRIIENSIANGWQGLFKIKEDGKQTTKDRRSKFGKYFAERAGTGNQDG